MSTAATLFVPTGELRRGCSARVGACGRRPLESADPRGGRVGLFEIYGSRVVVLDNVEERGWRAGKCAKESQEMVVFRKVRDSRSGDVPGAARVRDRVRGSSEEGS